MSSAESISSGSSQLSPLKQAFLALEDMQARLAASEREPQRTDRHHRDGMPVPGSERPIQFLAAHARGARRY